MNDAAHSPLGPSSAERWINCPGSVALTRDLPDVDSEYSIEGTAAHTVLEAVRKGYTIATDGQIAVDLATGRVGRIVTQEMIDGAQYFIDHMAELPGLEFNEIKVRYEGVVENGFGTLDGAKATDDTLYIRDYKFGKGVMVFAERNAQLMLYAQGFIETFGYLFPNITKLDLGIVQPRLDHIDTWECTVEELSEWVHGIAAPAAIEAMGQRNPRVVAGDWCQFCKIKSTCTVRARKQFEAILDDFESVDHSIQAIKDNVQHPGPGMSAEQLAAIVHAAPGIRKWLTDIEGYAFERTASGEKIGDLKIVEGKSNRAWGNDAEEIGDRLTRMGIDPWTTSLVSVAVAEKMIGKKEFAANAADLVTKPRGKPTLAIGTDRRPPMALDLINEFDDATTGD